jgi:hypothetical protein
MNMKVAGRFSLQAAVELPQPKKKERDRILNSAFLIIDSILVIVGFFTYAGRFFITKEEKPTPRLIYLSNVCSPLLISTRRL